jgi:hypothetical protein
MSEHQTMTSFPLLLKHMGVSFSFWFIFYRLCTNHYHTLSMVFFNPLNACFFTSTTHVHNLAMCISHSDFSTGCYIWSEFFISSTHHSQCTSVISQFVADDNSFVLDLLCYHWLSFCNHESSLHRVITWFLLIVCFCFFFGLCLLVFSFTLYFQWMGSILDFYLQGFPSEKVLPYKPKQSF